MAEVCLMMDTQLEPLFSPANFFKYTFYGILVSIKLFKALEGMTFLEFHAINVEKFATLAEGRTQNDKLVQQYIQELQENHACKILQYYNNQSQDILSCLADLCNKDLENKELYIDVIKQFLDGKIYDDGQLKRGGEIKGSEVVGILFKLANKCEKIIPQESVQALKRFWGSRKVHYLDILLHDEKNGVKTRNEIKAYIVDLDKAIQDRAIKNEAEVARLAKVDEVNKSYLSALDTAHKEAEKRAEKAKIADAKAAKEKAEKDKIALEEEKTRLLKALQKDPQNKKLQQELFKLNGIEEGFVTVKNRKNKN